MNVLGFFTAFLYLFGAFAILVGIVTAGLSVAALFMFRTNLLDARAYTLDYLGWIPGVNRENEWLGALALALTLLVGGVGIAVLGTFMMALPALV